MKQIIVVLVSIFFTLFSCKPEEKTPYTYNVVLTIDDGYVDNWYPYLDYMDSLHVKVTIYVTLYHKFTEEQKEKLLQFQERGHEIAYHTTNHLNINEFFKEHTIKDYFELEITPDLFQMHRDGFEVRNFAYPFGKSTIETDSVLTKEFKSIRKLVWTSEQKPIYTLEKILYDTCKTQILRGAGLDNAYTVTTDEIILAIENAKIQNKKILLYCHKLSNSGGKYQISIERFKAICEYCFQNNIKFITVNQLVDNVFL